MVRKFGSLAAFERVKAAHGLVPRGAEVGLDASVNYTEAQLARRVQSCTLNSHRLVLFVAARFGLGASERLYAALNRRHFTEAGVLNDARLLEAAVREVGLPEAGVAECVGFIADEARGRAEVLELLEQVERLGIHSIPTLVVDGRYLVSGAERAPQVLKVLERVVAGGGPTGTRAFAPRGILDDTDAPDDDVGAGGCVGVGGDSARGGGGSGGDGSEAAGADGAAAPAAAPAPGPGPAPAVAGRTAATAGPGVPTTAGAGNTTRP